MSFARDYIYALVDPDTGEARYVGETYYPRVRLHLHLANARREKPKHKGPVAWIRGLLAAGKKPRMVILAYMPEEHREEDLWILRLLYRGHRLTNKTEFKCKPSIKPERGANVPVPDNVTEEVWELLHWRRPA